MTLDYKKKGWGGGGGREGVRGENVQGEGCVSEFGRGLDFDSEGDGSDLDGLLW